MRAVVVIGLVACVGLLLQSTLLHDLAPIAIVPDILLVLCVYLGLNHHSIGGALGTFLLGYFQDSASGSPTGLNACGMLIVFVIVYLTCRRLWVDNVVSKLVLVFLASLVKTTTVIVLLALVVSSGSAVSSIPAHVLAQSALTSLVAPPVFWLLANTGIRSNRESE